MDDIGPGFLSPTEEIALFKKSSRFFCFGVFTVAAVGCSTVPTKPAASDVLAEALQAPTDANLQRLSVDQKLPESARLALLKSVEGDFLAMRESAQRCASDGVSQATCAKLVSLAALRQFDLVEWAKLQLASDSRSVAVSSYFPGLEVHSLSRDDLQRIVESGGGMKVHTRANSTDTRAYLGSNSSGGIPQGAGVELEDIRFNDGEVLPYGFGIDLTFPFTVLPSTSARMNGVQFIVESFASYRQSAESAPIEFSLGLLKSMEVANWRFDTPWVLIAKTIKSENGRLIGHSVGMDIVAATGGLRVSGDRRAMFGSFDSNECTGKLRWASGDLGSSYLIAQEAAGADWKLVVGANKFALGTQRLYSSDFLPRFSGLLDNPSDTGFALDVQGLKYCPPSGVKKIIKDAEQIKGT